MYGHGIARKRKTDKRVGDSLMRISTSGLISWLCLAIETVTAGCSSRKKWMSGFVPVDLPSNRISLNHTCADLLAYRRTDQSNRDNAKSALRKMTCKD